MSLHNNTTMMQTNSTLNHSEGELYQCEDYHSNNLVVLDQYRSIHGYVASIICILGILGNIANIVVLSRKKMATSPVNWLLMIIAIADLLLVSTYLPMSIYFYIVAHRPDKFPLYSLHKEEATYLYYSSAFILVFHSVAVWHTIAVASFRWLTLALSNGKAYGTLFVARICTVFLVIFNILLSIPNWIALEVSTVGGNVCHYENDTLWMIGLNPDSEYNNWIFAWFAKILPAVLLTALTIPLVNIIRNAAVHKRELLKRGSSSKEVRKHQEHNRTTAMLLVVVLVFLCIELPHGIVIIFMKDSMELSEFYNAIGEVIEIVTLIAFSINFILYATMSRLFRNTFKDVFCKWSFIHGRSPFQQFCNLFSTFKRRSTRKHSNLSNQSTAEGIRLRMDISHMNNNTLHPSSYPLMADDCTRSTSMCSSHSAVNTTTDAV